jgi:methyl-accepting chemotaxis protein
VTAVNLPSWTTAPPARARVGFGGRLLQRFMDLGIRIKVMTVVVLLGAVAVGGGFVAANGLNQASDSIRTLASTQSASTLPLLGLHANEFKARMQIALYSSETTAAGKQALLADMKGVDGEIDTTITKIDGAIGDAYPWWASFKTAWTQFKDVRDNQIIPALDAGMTRAEFTAAYAAKLKPINDTMGAAMDDAETATVDYFTGAADDASAEAHQDYVNQFVIIGVGLLIAFGLALLIARAIQKPIQRVQSSLEAMAQRDLTVPAEVTSRDEVGRMAAALDEAQTNIRTVMANVVGSADAVAASAEELSASSVQIAAAAEETSVQAGVVADASERVSGNVQTVAAGSEQMDASIREIARNATEAARVASTAVSAAHTTNDTVRRLGTSSEEIGNVVKAITSIAAQTNLLALNATIEAARAGEMGKGFAVVANEVKDLAQETQKATEEIIAKVQTIQADTNGAIEAIGQITEVIGTINESQLTIASAVEEQTATTMDMSRNVAQAANGATEIAQNIGGVADAASSTTQAVTQSRNATDELARMASDLRTQVSSFVY